MLDPKDPLVLVGGGNVNASQSGEHLRHAQGVRFANFVILYRICDQIVSIALYVKAQIKDVRQWRLSCKS